MVGRWRRRLLVVRELQRTELLALLPALIVVRLIALSLRLIGSAGTIRVLERVPVRTGRQPSIDEARRTARLVRGVGDVRPFAVSCLPKALTTWAWLRWQGLRSDVVLGVPADGIGVPGEFEAHAWVESDGAWITDRPEAVARFVAFDRPLAV